MTASNGKYSDVKADLQDYLNEKKINPLFVSLVESLLINKPDEPIGFIAKYLTDKFPSETNVFINHSGQEEKTNEMYHSDTDDSDSDSDESECHETKPPMPVVNRARRRGSICAEKLCPKTTETKVKHIPKTEEEATSIRKILQKNVLLEHLDEAQIETIQNAMFPVSKESEDIIIRQGEVGDNFYIIESGDVDVYIDFDIKEKSKLVASYSNGDSFGELAIMYNAPRAATCIAKSDVKLWALDRVSFKLILMNSTISKRKEHKGFLEKVPILSQLTGNELLIIVDALREEFFEDKAIICNETDNGDRFYIIQEGTAICTKRNSEGVEREVACLQSGAYFGEIALMTAKKRQATVKASGSLVCLSLDRKTFKRVMGPIQDILMRNIEEYNKFQASNI